MAPQCFPNSMQKNGFWSIHLDKARSYLTTFNTHKGRNWFLSICIRLKVSQDISSMQMDQSTNRLPGILMIHYNICAFGCTPEEHYKHLIQLMQVATKNILVFNSNKCRNIPPKIGFYGAVFTSKGVKPNPSKVQAL